MKKDKKDLVIATGMVLEALPNGFFRVKVDPEPACPVGKFEKIVPENKEILAHLSGKMRMHYIKVLVGDKVKLEISMYDTSKGRIVQRF